MDSLPSSRLLDVCNKLISGSVLVQYQALARVNGLITDLAANEVEKKRTVLKLIDSLRLIKSKNCCILLLKILLNHAKESTIDYNLLISTFQGLINSKSENSSYCLDLISELLIHFHKECAGYSIRNPTHPFIDILRNSNESDCAGTKVYEQINFIFEDNRINQNDAYKLLKPVFIYIFMEKNNLKHLVASFLIEKLEHKMDDQILELVNFYFKSLKKMDYNDVLLFKSILQLIDLYPGDKIICEKIKLNDLVLLLIDMQNLAMVNLKNYWKALSELFAQNPKLISSELLETLAANISKISINDLESYLNMIDVCLSNYNAPLSELNIFLPSLFLYVISFGHLESIDSLNSCRLMITSLIEKIENKKKNVEDNNFSIDSKIYNLVEYEDIDDSNQDPNEIINMNLFNKLSATFLYEFSDYEMICLIFEKLISKWPHLYSIIYCLFIYKIKRSSNTELISHLLNAMTNLINPKVDISLCLNTLRSLLSASTSEHIIIKLVCMKQLTKLCTMKYDYLVYPYLSNELVSIKSLKFGENDRLEVLYMQAYCINKIIQYRPDYYAQELLATISNLLNQSVNQNDQGISAILLDTISYLCESEVVDMMSTWSALLSQFKTEKRPLALNAFCRFMSVAAKLKHLESDNENSFYFKMINNLWIMSDPIENRINDKWSVISASLKELSKFDKSAFKCSLLPNFIQEKLKERNKKILEMEENKDKSINEIFAKVPSQCFMDYFESLEPEAYPGLACLFGRILGTEIDSIPRRSISFAKEKIFSEDEQIVSRKYFYDHIKNFLSDEFREDLIRLENQQNIDVGYVLFSYEPRVDRNLEGKIVKKHIKSYWKNYEQTLVLILKKGNFKINEYNLEYYINGFNHFINKSYNACIQTEIFETFKITTLQG